MIPEFHFLLLAIGEILKIDDCVTPQKIQDYIQNDEAFGVRMPLSQCRSALTMMENSGFIKHKFGDEYIWKNHFKKQSEE